MRQYSPSTVATRARDFRLFAAWCEERGLLRPAEVTKPILERYQRHLFHFRKPNGHPLSPQRQALLLTQLRMYFRWLCRECTAYAIDLGSPSPQNPLSDS